MDLEMEKLLYRFGFLKMPSGVKNKDRYLVDMTDFLPWFQTRLSRCAMRRGTALTVMNPVLSSAAISILLTMRGADHYGSVPLHEIYFGCKNKYTKEGLETECQELPGQLYERIQSAYRELEEVSDNV